MDYQKLMEAIDHTLLRPTTTFEDVRALCDEAVGYGAASICIPPCYVREAADYLDEKIPICTVIGFPHGNCTIGTKLFEAKTAISDGATEIDMVVNLGYLKCGRFDKIFSEVSGIKAMIGERNILKVIVETALLTEAEKIRACVMISQSGADYIKTSTGFSGPGATEEDIELFVAHAQGTSLKVKASGGIASLETAQRMLDLGASRIGMSSAVRLLKEQGVEPFFTANW